MGIQTLMPLLTAHCAHAIRAVTLEQYRERTLAIDVPVLMYRYAHSASSAAESGAAACAERFLALHRRLQQHSVGAIYVFDGAPPVAKQQHVLQQRKRARTQQRESLQRDEQALAQLGASERCAVPDIEQCHVIDTSVFIESRVEFAERVARKRQRVATVVRREHYDVLREALRAHEIAYVNAPDDAERHCVSLCRAGHAYAVASDDTDALAFGATRTLRNLDSGTRALHEIALADVLDALRLTHAQFVDLCILCGCDYASKLPGVGRVRALRYMQRHGSLEQFLASADAAPYAAHVAQFDFCGARRQFLRDD